MIYKKSKLSICANQQASFHDAAHIYFDCKQLMVSLTQDGCKYQWKISGISRFARSWYKSPSYRIIRMAGTHTCDKSAFIRPSRVANIHSKASANSLPSIFSSTVPFDDCSEIVTCTAHNSLIFIWFFLWAIEENWIEINYIYKLFNFPRLINYISGYSKWKQPSRRTIHLVVCRTHSQQIFGCEIPLANVEMSCDF